MEIFGWELTDSRISRVFEGPIEKGFRPAEDLVDALRDSKAGLMRRKSKTVLRLNARAHSDAIRERTEEEPPRVDAEHEAYRESLCYAHIPVINELIQRYRLATYDYFPYEVSPWDVPVWQVGDAQHSSRVVLVTYKTWDDKPATLEDGTEPGDPSIGRPFQFATAEQLDAVPSSVATPGEFDLLDARSLMERGDYTGAVRRTVTAIEAVLEWALAEELRKIYPEEEVERRLEASKSDFPGRARQWLKLARPSIGWDRFERFEETRAVRHEIVHRGRRLTESDRGQAQMFVDKGRWLYNAVEGKPDRTRLRDFAPSRVLRSVGRTEMSPRFPFEVDESGITIRPFILPEPPTPLDPLGKR